MDKEREIKFRVWEGLTKKMLKVESHDFKAGMPDNCYLMQYTGLKDKNGKEIYEGDILRYSNEERIVVYVAPSFELQLKDTAAFAWDNWSEFGEVIGNIYENK